MLWRHRSNSSSDNDGDSNYGNDDNDKLLDGPRQGITCQNLGTLQVVSLYCNLSGIELKLKIREKILFIAKDLYTLPIFYLRIIISSNILHKRDIFLKMYYIVIEFTIRNGICEIY